MVSISSGKCYRTKMLRKALILPLAFISDTCGSGGSDGIVSGMAGVTGRMGGCGSVTGCARSGASCDIIGGAGSGMSGECGSTDIARCYLITNPGPACFNSFPGPVIFRVSYFEVWKYMFGTFGGPEHQRLVVLMALLQ
jgi:hypothetical protein